MQRLELRAPADVTKAFVLSPLAAVGAFWLCVTVLGAFEPHGGMLMGLILLPWLLIFGGLLAVILELLVALPLVIAMRRYRWRWMNWGAVVAIGFLTGALPVAVLGVDWTDLRHSVLDTPALASLAGFGVTGIVGAVTFARIAAQPAGEN